MSIDANAFRISDVDQINLGGWAMKSKLRCNSKKVYRNVPHDHRWWIACTLGRCGIVAVRA